MYANVLGIHNLDQKLTLAQIGTWQKCHWYQSRPWITHLNTNPTLVQNPDLGARTLAKNARTLEKMSGPWKKMSGPWKKMSGPWQKCPDLGKNARSLAKNVRTLIKNVQTVAKMS